MAVTNVKARNAEIIGFMIILLICTLTCLSVRDGHDT
jgi:hypothetical protein